MSVSIVPMMKTSLYESSQRAPYSHYTTTTSEKASQASTVNERHLFSSIKSSEPRRHENHCGHSGLYWTSHPHRATLLLKREAEPRRKQSFNKELHCPCTFAESSHTHTTSSSPTLDDSATLQRRAFHERNVDWYSRYGSNVM
jgi:hypothetical protein